MNTAAAARTTYTATVRRPGDYGYEDITEPSWVLEDATGEWVADLKLKASPNMNDIEHAVSLALQTWKTQVRVIATPQGGNINGDASHRNGYVSADQWAVVVADA